MTLNGSDPVRLLSTEYTLSGFYLKSAFELTVCKKTLDLLFIPRKIATATVGSSC